MKNVTTYLVIALMPICIKAAQFTPVSAYHTTPSLVSVPGRRSLRLLVRDAGHPGILPDLFTQASPQASSLGGRDPAGTTPASLQPSPSATSSGMITTLPITSSSGAILQLSGVPLSVSGLTVSRPSTPNSAPATSSLSSQGTKIETTPATSVTPALAVSTATNTFNTTPTSASTASLDSNTSDTSPHPSLANISTHWKIIGISVIAFTAVGLVVLFSVFFDAIARFLADVFCGCCVRRRRKSELEELRGGAETPDWETGAWVVRYPSVASLPSVAKLARQRSMNDGQGWHSRRDGGGLYAGRKSESPPSVPIVPTPPPYAATRYPQRQAPALYDGKSLRPPSPENAYDGYISA